jgi:hypothetical protein
MVVVVKVIIYQWIPPYLNMNGIIQHFFRKRWIMMICKSKMNILLQHLISHAKAQTVDLSYSIFFLLKSHGISNFIIF